MASFVVEEKSGSEVGIGSYNRLDGRLEGGATKNLIWLWWLLLVVRAKWPSPSEQKNLAHG